MTFHPDPTNGGDTIQGAYKGEGSPLFWLAVRTGFFNAPHSRDLSVLGQNPHSAVHVVGDRAGRCAL
jgi:hypothetical protein